MDEARDEARDAAIHAARMAAARYGLAPLRSAAPGRLGHQLAHGAGSSIEFMDHRPYQPGDDIRRIDWSAYARTDRLIVKLYRQEVTPHLDLCLDTSRSMDATPAKSAAALGLGAAFMEIAAASGFSATLWQAGERLEPLHTGSRGEAPWWRDVRFEGERPLPELLQRASPPWRPRGVRVLISDLLQPVDPGTLLHPLAEGGSRLLLVQLWAHEDLDPPEHGNVRLVDAETGEVRELFLDEAERQRYRRRVQGHHARWSEACRRLGASLVWWEAESLLEEWTLDELVTAGVLSAPFIHA